ncbi:MAG: trypsin-like peptidase domain-containing protein [Clostridia bacterium]|nr:trypsin-like peptidase domain-containing protein [Clostridia bacterium]
MSEENNVFESQPVQPCEQSGNYQSYYVRQGEPARPCAPSGYAPLQTPDTSCSVPQKQKIGAGKLIAIFAIVVALSLVVGGIGGYLAARVMPGDSAASTSPSQSGSVVIYQSTDNGSYSPNLSSGATISDIADKVAPSVVEITTKMVIQGGMWTPQQITSGAGSGVIISADGYIITNNHVVEGAEAITVILNNGESYAATVIGTDLRTDIAVIKIDETGLTPAVIGKSDTLRVGDFVLGVGNPLGLLGGTVTDGIISALERQIVVEGITMTLLQTNAALNPGNSGGGLFNAAGELIGIVNCGMADDGVEGLNFAIPINTVKPVVEDIITLGYVTGRAYAGFYGDEVSYGWSVYVCVSGTVAGGPAEQAGMKAGDIIVAVDDNTIDSRGALSAAISQYEPGESAKLTIIRNGREIEITLTFAEYKPE